MCAAGGDPRASGDDRNASDPRPPGLLIQINTFGPRSENDMARTTFWRSWRQPDPFPSNGCRPAARTRR